MYKAIYEDNSYGVGHTGPDCACKPDKVDSYVQKNTGGYGRHQGYTIVTTYVHHELPEDFPEDDIPITED